MLLKFIFLLLNTPLPDGKSSLSITIRDWSLSNRMNKDNVPLTIFLSCLFAFILIGMGLNVYSVEIREVNEYKYELLYQYANEVPMSKQIKIAFEDKKISNYEFRCLTDEYYKLKFEKAKQRATLTGQ